MDENLILAKYIDHTNLRPEATVKDIQALCFEAIRYGFHSVCVNPCWVKLARETLEDSSVKVCTVIGFPLGANLSNTKVSEMKQALDHGADEFDMVINLGWAKSENWRAVGEEITGGVAVAGGNVVKVIIETCLLTREEVVEACHVVEDSGAAFLKTSTGFSKQGATIENVELMRSAISPHMGLKAAGGIKDRATAEAMIAAGATRIGTSAGVAIVGLKPR
ncbi:MAG: deoxyribose-phosphate aldolase [Chlamydiota bacterium]